MKFVSESDARVFGEKCCPAGWRIKVWDNLGWSVHWTDGQIVVATDWVPSDDQIMSRLATADFDVSHVRFRAFFPHMLGGRAGWAGSGSGLTVLDAVRVAYGDLRGEIDGLLDVDKHVRSAIGVVGDVAVWRHWVSFKPTLAHCGGSGKIVCRERCVGGGFVYWLWDFGQYCLDIPVGASGSLDVIEWLDNINSSFVATIC